MAASEEQTEQERMAYLALSQVPGIGPGRLGTLLEACHTPFGAISAPFELLCSLPGLSPAFATAIRATSPDAGRRLLEAAGKVGAEVLLPGDRSFPELLRTVPDPPAVLFALGNLRLLAHPAVAIVGSRAHTAYGAEVTRNIAAAAARSGLVVVSGMARGLDAVAHGAALDAGGGTIGVLGNGLGVIYPAANRALYERVGEAGLLLTEFPPGERPRVGSFPRRNRLISGLARVTVVVEAGAGSGALITAGTALDQGRDVMAVPGPITSVVSIGTNRLIRDGATPFLEPADLLQQFPEMGPEAGRARDVPLAATPLPDFLTAQERALAGLLGEEPIHLDDVVGRAARPVGEVLAALCHLELAGVVEQHPGRWFRRS